MAYDVNRIRKEFPSLESGIAFFDGPGGSQVPRAVGEAIAKAITQPTSNRNTVTISEQNAEDCVQGYRNAVADLLNCDPKGVIYGRSWTQLTYDMSRNLAKSWGPGDEIIVTRIDHDSNIRPWVQAAEAKGATVKWAEFDVNTAELPVEAITSLLNNKTKFVACSDHKLNVNPFSKEKATQVGKEAIGAEVKNYSTKTVSPDQLLKDFDAVVISGGSEQPRDLPVPGRELKGVHYALEFLIPQNKENAGDFKNEISAAGKHVVVIGGGDTGSDCVGTSNRHGAAKVTQFELLPQPPETENKPLVWPYWPTKLRTSSSHEEGCERDWSVATKRFEGKDGKLEKLICVRLEWKDGKMTEMPNSEFEIKADLVFLAMGFVSPAAQVLNAFGVEKDARGNAKATVDGQNAYQTNVPKVFAAGDMRRGQSLVVWAIREGRQAAQAVDEYLMGSSVLPR